MTPYEYLKLPYCYGMIWDEESQTWAGRVAEFPGCFAQGDTWSIVWNLKRAAHDWIAAALELGQDIPPPIKENTK